MEQDLTSLHDHTAVVKRRWRLIALFVVLGLLAGIALALVQAPAYSSQTTLLLQNRVSTATGTTEAMEPEEVSTQAEVVLSDPVARRVIDSLQLNTTTDALVETVTVEGLEDKRVLEITATRSDAKEAADVANAFAEEYVSLRADRTVAARAAIREAYLTQLQDIEKELVPLRQEFGDASVNKRAELAPEVRSLAARKAELQTSLLTAEDPAAALSTGGAVLQSGETPKSPSEPKPLRAGLIGLVVGLVLGTIVAYIRDRSDDGVRSSQRLSSALAHTPVLGQIPTEPHRHRGRVTTLLDPRSPVSEAYRALNTNIRFLLAAHTTSAENSLRGAAAGMVMITSAAPAEGKTTVATNLAVSAARVGVKVILVDADLRDPGVAQRFGFDIPEGLSDVLSSNRPVESHLHDVGVENLRVLAAGSIPSNPAELLASPRARSVWQELREAADLVIIDTPPVMRVADPLEIVREVDEIVIVARQGRSRANQIRAAGQRIAQVGGRPTGAVLNAFADKDDSYGYAYGRAAEMSR